jgi:hypothetical protein
MKTNRTLCASTELSQEHPLPRCLGSFKNYSALNDRICISCNNKCRLLDEQLCRSGGEAFFRRYLSIEGRKGQAKINPSYRGSAKGGRLAIQGDDLTTGKRVDLGFDEKNIRELRHVALTAEDGTYHIIPIPEGMTPSKFKEAFDNLGIKRAKEGYVYADFSERQWVQSLLDTLKIDKQMEWTEGAKPTTYTNVAISFTVTNRYFRALAKIGFHYFLTKMSDFRGDEDCFNEIRNFIMTETDIKTCERFVSYRKGSLIFGGWQPARWGHIVTAEIDYMNLTSRLQLFLGPEFLPPIYTIQLGQNPSRIHYRRADINFYEYYPNGQRAEYDGEVITGFSIQA